jgi:DNA-binding MarR family transcriptional regulator
MNTKNDITEDILIALRRVIRAIDQHSRQLVQSHGLTGPQALLLSELVRRDGMTGSELARRISLSHATVTDVTKRLEARGLLQRQRQLDDKRRVLLLPTEAGRALVKVSVPLLQERFQQRLAGLQHWEQTQLLSALQRIAEMMDAEEIDASPLLASGSLRATADAVEKVVAVEPDETEAAE